jgi:hypothetical protein
MTADTGRGAYGQTANGSITLSAEHPPSLRRSPQSAPKPQYPQPATQPVQFASHRYWSVHGYIQNVAPRESVRHSGAQSVPSHTPSGAVPTPATSRAQAFSYSVRSQPQAASPPSGHETGGTTQVPPTDGSHVWIQHVRPAGQGGSSAVPHATASEYPHGTSDSLPTPARMRSQSFA